MDIDMLRWKYVILVKLPKATKYLLVNKWNHHYDCYGWADSKYIKRLIKLGFLVKVKDRSNIYKLNRKYKTMLREYIRN